MLRNMMFGILTTLLLYATSGCGTVFNLAGEEVCVIGCFPKHPTAPFGGVDNDLIWMRRGPGAELPAAIDMPFSFVGDIITLPWTAFKYYVLATVPVDSSKGYKSADVMPTATVEEPARDLTPPAR